MIQNPITKGKILSQLYSDDKVRIEGYEKMEVFLVTISNLNDQIDELNRTIAYMEVRLSELECENRYLKGKSCKQVWMYD